MEYVSSSEEQTVVGEAAAPTNPREPVVTGDSSPVKAVSANGLEQETGLDFSPAAVDEPSDGNEVPPSTPKYHSQEDEPPQQVGGIDTPSLSEESESHIKSSDIYTSEGPAKSSEELVAGASHPEEALKDAVTPLQESPLQVSETPTIEKPSLSDSDSQVGENGVCTEASDSSRKRSPVAAGDGPVTVGDDAPLDASIEAKNADIPEDVVVSHILDTPEEASDPLSGTPADNPFVALKEGLLSDGGAPQGALSEEKPKIQDQSVYEAPSEDSKCEESHLGPDMSSLKPEEEEACLLDDRESGESEKGDESKSQVDPMVVDESAKGLQHVFEIVTEENPAADATQVIERDIFVHESHAKEAVPAKGSVLSSKFQDAMEANKPEASEGVNIPHKDEEAPLANLSTGKSCSVDAEPCSGGVAPRTAANGENDTVNIPHKDEEAPIADLSTGKSCSTDAEQCCGDGAALQTAANGENDIPHDGVDHVVEREQHMPKGDEDEGAKGKENPGFSMKLPLVVTGLAVAVGVAVASMSRSR